MIGKNEFKEKNSENDIRNKITLITFIASLFVIYIHTYNLTVYGIDENAVGLGRVVYAIEGYWPSVLQMAVPLFFFISGLLFFRNFHITDLARKWKKRFATVVIPYFIWCTIYYLYNVICMNIPWIRAHMTREEVITLSVASWLRSLWSDSYYTLWFLKDLIVFLCLSPVIWLLLKNHWKQVPTGLIALIIIEIALKKGWIVIPYGGGLDIYLIGSYIGLNCDEHMYWRNRLISVCAVLYIIFCLVTSFRYWNLITEILLFIAIWFACDWIPWRDSELPWWMKITFFTYVAHDIFLEAFEKIFLIVFGVRPIFALLDYLLMPLLVELALIMIAYFMKKWMPVIWKILTGDRERAVK